MAPDLEQRDVRRRVRELVEAGDLAPLELLLPDLHPTDVADVLIPGATLPEKEGTFTNLQGRVQRFHQAYPPKGQAVTDLEALRRVASRLFPDDPSFRTADALDVFAALRAETPDLAEVSA